MSTDAAAPSLQKHPRYAAQLPLDVVDERAVAQSLAIEDISLGGLFACTQHPATPGSTLRMRLHAATPIGPTIGLVGRVVHVIDDNAALLKVHPPGMGVHFEELSAVSAAQLRAVVDELAEAAMRERVQRAMTVRLVDSTVVVIPAERTLVAQLWHAGLDKGGLFAEGAPAPLGTQIKVVIGRLVFFAEVVHVQPGVGVGLHAQELMGDKRAALLRFVEGETATIDLAQVLPFGTLSGPPIGKVLAAARRLFMGIEENDPFGAIALEPTATAEQVHDRIAGLVRLFSAPRPDATFPQRARLQHARDAVERLEPALRARAIALRQEAVIVRHVEAPVPPAPPPNHEPQALDKLNRALVLAAGVGMRKEALVLVGDALQMSRTRDVRLRAVAVLAKSGEFDEAADLGDQLVAEDPRDALALYALFSLREKMKQWAAATRAGEALLRVKRQPPEIQQRVLKAAENARKR